MMLECPMTFNFFLIIIWVIFHQILKRPLAKVAKRCVVNVVSFDFVLNVYDIKSLSFELFGFGVVCCRSVCFRVGDKGKIHNRTGTQELDAPLN